MANDSMRSKAAAIFGKEFMNVVKGGNAGGTQVNGAQALQKRANARPIPVYKDGGKVSKAEVTQARIATRAKAAGYKDGGDVDKYKAKLDRKMADIKKDYEKSLAKGKSEGVAKAKYEQRMADARDDYAKWTKADRTETKAAERASEAALSEARKTKGTSIIKRDAASVAAERAKADTGPTAKTEGASDLAKAIKMETKAMRAAAKPAVKRVTATRSTPAPKAAPAPRADTAMRPRVGITKDMPQPAAVRPRVGITKDIPQPAARGLTGAINQDVGRAVFERAARPQASAGAPTYDMRKAARLAELKAKADAPGATQYDKDRYKFAARSGMVGNFAAGGAAKTRKGQAPIKKGR